MNRVILMGRLTRDPEVRYSQGERSMAIAVIPLRWTAEGAGARTTMESRRLISSTVWPLTAQVNSLRSISARE